MAAVCRLFLSWWTGAAENELRIGGRIVRCRGARPGQLTSALVTLESPGTPLTTYVESYTAETEPVVAARDRAVQLGCRAVAPAIGAALRFLATALRARAVVEVGTGAGISGLYLLAGMAPEGVLTSIDVEPEHQRAARRAFSDGGYPVGRSRLIIGRALEVLPRLTDAGYDLVFVNSEPQEYPRCHEEGLRLLRLGGVIAFGGMLRHGRIADPARRDPETVAMRELARTVRDDDRLQPLLLPLADGLLAAARAR